MLWNSILDVASFKFCPHRRLHCRCFECLFILCIYSFATTEKVMQDCTVKESDGFANHSLSKNENTSNRLQSRLQLVGYTSHSFWRLHELKKQNWVLKSQEAQTCSRRRFLGDSGSADEILIGNQLGQYRVVVFFSDARITIKPCTKSSSEAEHCIGALKSFGFQFDNIDEIH